MEYNKVNELVTEKANGTIRTIRYTKELKTRKGVNDVITKETLTQGRFGVTYNNIGTVKDAREVGNLPKENAGLPKNTEWLDERRLFIKNIVTGKIQLRVSKINTTVHSVKYYKNGELVDKKDIVDICLKSEFPDYTNKTPSPIFNVGIEKITYIK